MPDTVCFPCRTIANLILRMSLKCKHYYVFSFAEVVTEDKKINKLQKIKQTVDLRVKFISA